MHVPPPQPPPPIPSPKWKGHTFCNEVFFRMYFPLALEVYNRLFIESLGFMAVDIIEKYLLGLAQLSNLNKAPMSAPETLYHRDDSYTLPM